MTDRNTEHAPIEYTTRLERLIESTIDCPMCGSSNTFLVRHALYDMPRFGPTILLSGKCSSCGYKFAWILPAEERGERILRREIRGPSDLNALVLLGEGADVVLPELETEILATDLEPGFITTVEGLLLRILDRARAHCERGCEEAIEKLERASRGEIPFTLIVIDKHGRSAIYELSDEPR
ncbi:MAG: hypothetical protein QXU97_03940 [Fervidicoccaceae archaeon]